MSAILNNASTSAAPDLLPIYKFPLVPRHPWPPILSVVPLNQPSAVPVTRCDAILDHTPVDGTDEPDTESFEADSGSQEEEETCLGHQFRFIRPKHQMILEHCIELNAANVFPWILFYVDECVYNEDAHSNFECMETSNQQVLPWNKQLIAVYSGGKN